MDNDCEDRVIVFDDLQYKGSLSSSITRHFYSTSTSAALVARPVDGITTFHIIIGHEYIPLHERFTVVPNLFEDYVEPMTIQLSCDDKALYLKFTDEIVLTRWNKVIREAIAECIYTSTFISLPLTVDMIEEAILRSQPLVSSVHCHTLRAMRLIQVKTKLEAFISHLSSTTSQEEAQAVYDEVSYDPLMLADPLLKELQNTIPSLLSAAHIKKLTLAKQQSNGRIRNCLVSPLKRKRPILVDITNISAKENPCITTPIKSHSTTTDPVPVVLSSSPKIAFSFPIVSDVCEGPNTSLGMTSPPSSCHWVMARSSSCQATSNISRQPNSHAATPRATAIHTCVLVSILLAILLISSVIHASKPVQTHFNAAFLKYRQIPINNNNNIIELPLPPYKGITLPHKSNVANAELGETSTGLWENIVEESKVWSEKYFARRISLTVRYSVIDDEE